MTTCSWSPTTAATRRRAWRAMPAPRLWNATIRSDGARAIALQHGIDQLRAAPPDVITIVDADCIIDPASLRVLSAACLRDATPGAGALPDEGTAGAGVRRSHCGVRVAGEERGPPAGHETAGWRLPPDGLGHVVSVAVDRRRATGLGTSRRGHAAGHRTGRGRRGARVPAGGARLQLLCGQCRGRLEPANAMGTRPPADHHLQRSAAARQALRQATGNCSASRSTLPFRRWRCSSCCRWEALPDLRC